MLSWLGSDKTKSKSIRTRALPLRIILLSIATWAYICVDSLSADNSAYAHSSTIWCTLSIILSSHLLSSHLSSHPALYPLIYSSNYTSHGSETSMDALPPQLNRGASENVRLGAIIADPFKPNQVLTTPNTSILDAFYPPVNETTQPNRFFLWIADQDAPSLLRRC